MTEYKLIYENHQTYGGDFKYYPMPFFLVPCKMCGILFCTGQLDKKQFFICVAFRLERSESILKAETGFSTWQAVGIDQNHVNSFLFINSWNYSLDNFTKIHSLGLCSSFLIIISLFLSSAEVAFHNKLFG